jgi:predicted alpha-1,2-mannosidase
MDAAWEGMLKDITQAPPRDRPYKGEEGIEWINQVHYVPDDKISYGSVSKTQEYAIAAASLYRLAQALGKTDDAKMLHDRALYYRNVFDHEDRFFRPRNADGTWVPEFNPARYEHGFVEGSGWHYQSFAPTDLAWLIDAVGQPRFNERMNEYFDYREPGWYTNHYTPYNEIDMQAPFVFNFSGEPWMSQRVVRRVLRENYFDAPDGIPGNDDCGATSSWAVLSMMGIYSVDPASLAYELVVPTFSKIVIHLHEPYLGKAFSIKASGAATNSGYIQGVKLNGTSHAKNWITLNSITTGGTLHFTLGSEPNRTWGTTADALPPSLSDIR